VDDIGRSHWLNPPGYDDVRRQHGGPARYRLHDGDRGAGSRRIDGSGCTSTAAGCHRTRGHTDAGHASEDSFWAHTPRTARPADATRRGRGLGRLSPIS
jgi:hypothetical protein